MRVKGTLLLLLLVVGLGAFILLYERMRPGTDEREQQARRALRVNPELVTSLRIEQTNLVVDCVLDDDRWRMQEPVEAYADKGAVNRILVGLQEMPKRDVITAEERARHGTRLEDYGLAAPIARIHFRQDNRDRTIWIGNPAAVGDGLYIAEAGEQDVSVIVTSTNLWDILPRDAGSIRSRHLLPGLPPKLKRIEVKRASGFLQLVLDDYGQWRIHQPVVGRASGAFVRDFASKFLGAQAETFEADRVLDLAPYGLDVPEAQIVLWPQAGSEPHVVSLGDVVEDAPDQVYATTGVGRSVYTVARRLLVEANLEADILRDRQLVSLNQAAIGYLAIRAEEEEIELRKDDAGGWSLTKPLLRDAEDQVVWDFLAHWNGLRIHRFVTDSATNLPWLATASPLGEVFLAQSPPGASADPAPAPTSLGPPASMTIKAYALPDTPGEILLTLSHEPGVFAIDAADVDAWSVNPLDYYARDVLHLAAADVRRITLERGGESHSVERGADGVFAPFPAGSGSLVPGAVDQVLAAVGSLTVARYLHADADAETLTALGLTEPSAALTFRLRGDTGIAKTLLFGAAAETGERVAMIRGQNTVFVLPADAQRQLLRDLLIRPMPPDTAAQGRLASGPDNDP
jgi:hypothetical protein